MHEAAFVLAASIGLVLGALGGGGSILTVPVLVYGLGIDPKQAVAMSLPIVALTSLVAMTSYWRTRDLNLRWAFMFGLFAMAGAYGGARIGVLLPAAVQLTLLALVSVAAGLSMTRSSASAGRPSAVGGEHPRLSWLAALSTVAVGIVTGLVGIGGGFLIVPVLVLLMHLPMRVAVGTSLLVIAMNAAAGLLGYAGSVSIPWSFVLVFAATSAVGALAGAWPGARASAATLQRAFGILLFVMAAAMLFDNVPWRQLAIGTIDLAGRVGVCSD
jgi:uncharacterized membrane protein YfcA